MISFIIIGRNEGWKLSLCFNSIFETIRITHLNDYEVIYVDSDSSDDSIQRALSFDEVHVVKLTGRYNPAIGRNAGAGRSEGDILFFIDGDMEIKADFLPLVYNEQEGLKQEFVSGQFINYYYSPEGNLIEAGKGKITAKDTKEFTTGGLFLIQRSLWERVGGMKPKLRINEDIDFALRLSKTGTCLLRKKEVLAIHHTVSYHDNSRLWKNFFRGNDFYRAVLMRDNVANLNQWKLLMRENYSSLFLAGLIIFVSLFHFPWMLILYFLLILFRVSRKNASPGQHLNLIPYLIVRDISFWFALIFFFPVKKGESQIIIMVRDD